MSKNNKEIAYTDTEINRTCFIILGQSESFNWSRDYFLQFHWLLALRYAQKKENNNDNKTNEGNGHHAFEVLKRILPIIQPTVTNNCSLLMDENINFIFGQ